jgi:hypothetical protein
MSCAGGDDEANMSRNLIVAMSPRDGEHDRELAADRVHLFQLLVVICVTHLNIALKRETYSNQSREVGGAEIALRVHVQNSSRAAAGRPGLDARRGLEVEVATHIARKIYGIERSPWGASEGERVLAFTRYTAWDLTKPLHLRVKDGEPGNARLANVLLCKCVDALRHLRHTGSQSQTPCSW